MALPAGLVGLIGYFWSRPSGYGLFRYAWRKRSLSIVFSSLMGFASLPSDRCAGPTERLASFSYHLVADERSH